MTDVPEDAMSSRVTAWWAVLLPILCFLSGGAGFFYEVLIGHNTLGASLCALWAAGGPALLADYLLRSAK